MRRVRSTIQGIRCKTVSDQHRRGQRECVLRLQRTRTPTQRNSGNTCGSTSLSVVWSKGYVSYLEIYCMGVPCLFPARNLVWLTVSPEEALASGEGACNSGIWENRKVVAVYQTRNFGYSCRGSYDPWSHEQDTAIPVMPLRSPQIWNFGGPLPQKIPYLKSCD